MSSTTLRPADGEQEEPRLRALDARARAATGWLVADVGGTNARFGWVDAPSGDVREARVVRDVRTLAVQAHPSLADAAAAYLQALGEQRGGPPLRPSQAALACATTVGGDRVDFTNSAWTFSRAELQRALGVQRLLVLNDFEALALSLPRLAASQLRAHGAWPEARGTLAVVGPGTGLGVAGVVQTGAGWQALPGEGGHATLAATDEHEAALLQFVRREFSHVSAERLLSGIGLPVLHRAVAAVAGRAGEDLQAPDIVERGISGRDRACESTLDAFCALLGSFCGNVALTLGARGGLAIGGGIVPRLGDRFFASRFRERFEAKGRFRGYLEAVPTAVITDTHAALSGAVLALEQAGA